MSDSDTEPKDLRDSREPTSPFETIPEIGAPLENATTASTVKVDLNYQGLEGDISTADDGPVFRATIKALESKTGSVRQRMKKVLKKAEAAKDSQLLCNASIAAFMEALREASTSNANAVQPALDHYFEKIAKEILFYERQNVDNLQRLIIDPLTRIYGNEIKQAEAKKKDFEDESRDYYAYVGRYLGQRQDSLKEKKRAESDSKYENKRKTFELKRFDYSSFMQDLHGGRKDQEVLSQLTRYADAQASGYLSAAKRIEAMLPQLEALSYEVREADKQYDLFRTGREERRRTLEKSSKSNLDSEGTTISLNNTIAPETDTSLSTSGSANTLVERPRSGVPLGANGIANAAALDPNLSSSPKLQANALSGSPGIDRFKGYRDLESKDPNTDIRQLEPRKEGLLWSLSRPGSHADPKGLNKQAWHKSVSTHRHLLLSLVNYFIGFGWCWTKGGCQSTSTGNKTWSSIWDQLISEWHRFARPEMPNDVFALKSSLLTSPEYTKRLAKKTCEAGFWPSTTLCRALLRARVHHWLRQPSPTLPEEVLPKICLANRLHITVIVRRQTAHILVIQASTLTAMQR